MINILDSLFCRLAVLVLRVLDFFGINRVIFLLAYIWLAIPLQLANMVPWDAPAKLVFSAFFILLGCICSFLIICEALLNRGAPSDVMRPPLFSTSIGARMLTLFCYPMPSLVYTIDGKTPVLLFLGSIVFSFGFSLYLCEMHNWPRGGKRLRDYVREGASKLKGSLGSLKPRLSPQPV